MIPRPHDRLLGLVVKVSASRAEDPGFESRLRRDFSGSSHTSDLKIGTPVGKYLCSKQCPVMTDQVLTVTYIVQSIEFRLGIRMKEELSLPSRYVPFKLLGMPQEPDKIS